MKKREFAKSVVFTASVSFLIITFIFIGLCALVDDNAVKYERFVFFRYVFGKLFCIFLFSFSLGFINRITELEKMPKALKRILHFVSASAAFVLFMVIMFYGIFDNESLNVKSGIGNYVLFLLGYFISVGVNALYKKITSPKEVHEYKSMIEDSQNDR